MGNINQFFLFILTSSISAIFNFTSRIFLNYWFSYSVSIFLAYIIGVVVAYVLARSFVFNAHSLSIYKSSFKFIQINFVGFIQTWLVSIVLAYRVFPYFDIRQTYIFELSHFIALSSLAFTSFLGHKYYSFR